MRRRIALKLGIAALFFFAAWLCLAGKTVRLASWNVRNYNVCDRMVDETFRKEYPKPEAEKAALRRVLKEISPDVVAFQEMGPRPFLEELQRDLRAEGLDYPFVAQVEGADPARTLALLSKIPFSFVQSHDKLPAQKTTYVSRGLLEAGFETEGVPWRLYVLHLKSRRTVDKSDPQAQRQRRSEARAIFDKICESNAADYVVAGDFNDNGRSAAMRAFTGTGRNSTGVRPLPACDRRGEIWTYFYASQEWYQRFDFFLCSPAMAARAKEARGHVADSPDVLKASDHRLIWADFDFAKNPNAQRQK